MNPATKSRMIRDLGSRFDFVRDTIEQKALSAFSRDQWGEMAVFMERAKQDLDVCAHNARLLARLEDREKRAKG